MTDNHRTLFCVVDGETSFNAFPVAIELTKTIYNLKKLIKAKKTNNFYGVDANEHTLWSVSVKAIDKLKPIVWNDPVFYRRLQFSEEAI
ncbi:hypothetical protein BGZ74_007802 [Mortierella antarctica]|nr:hypothetical protein BGZ74_007802 [Mortierella antarctica]